MCDDNNKNILFKERESNQNFYFYCNIIIHPRRNKNLHVIPWDSKACKKYMLMLLIILNILTRDHFTGEKCLVPDEFRISSHNSTLVFIAFFWKYDKSNF